MDNISKDINIKKRRSKRNRSLNNLFKHFDKSELKKSKNNESYQSIQNSQPNKKDKTNQINKKNPMNKKNQVNKKHQKNINLVVHKKHTKPKLKKIKIDPNKKEPTVKLDKKSKSKKRSNSKRYKSKNNRRVSLLLSDSTSDADLDRLIRKVKRTPKTRMIKELKGKGITISGKSNKLLQDIYLYSQIDNITIKKE